MDKVKQAAKDLRKLQKEGKDEKDPKVAAATTKLQNAIQNRSMMHHILVGLQTDIPVKT